MSLNVAVQFHEPGDANPHVPARLPTMASRANVGQCEHPVLRQ